MPYIMAIVVNARRISDPETSWRMIARMRATPRIGLYENEDMGQDADRLTGCSHVTKRCFNND